VQSATQTATIVQTNARGDNRVRVSETSVQRSIERSGAGTTRQEQRTRQMIRLEQRSQSGANEALLAQSVVLNALAVSTRVRTQLQNTGSGSTVPESRAEVSQTSDTGANTLELEQRQTFSATAPAGTLQQVQSAAAGGLIATIHQTTRGISQAAVDQSERMDLKGGPNAKQRQFGPIKSCSTQQGSKGTRMDIVQSSLLTASAKRPGQSTTVDGRCESTGICTIEHVATINGARKRSACNDRACVTRLRR
jgi:hypothetical protein